jgi:hypothetical protein
MQACPFCMRAIPAPLVGAQRCQHCGRSGGAPASGPPPSAFKPLAPAEVVMAEVVPEVRAAPAPFRPSAPAPFQPSAAPVIASREPSLVEGYVANKLLGFGAKLLFFLLLMPLAGAYMVFYQATEVLPRATNREPQKLKASELLQQSGTVVDGTHVALSDFRFETARISTNLAGTDQEWSKAFVPIVAKDAPIDGNPVRVLLETEDAQTPPDLQELMDDNKVQGVLFRGTFALELGEVFLLGAKYPDKLDDCLILKHNRTPTRPLVTYFLIGLGVVMALSGIPIYYVAFGSLFGKPTS